MNTKKLLSVLTVIMMVSVCFSAPFSSGAQPEFAISVQGDHGTFADSEGNLYTGGKFAGPMTLTFNPVGGYEFVEWNITGACEHTENLNHITISSVSEDITVTAVTRNYSTSHGLMSKIDVDDLLGPEDDIVNNWSFASTRLERVGDQWIGMPSVPLIVGDRVYVRAGELIYELDSKNGSSLKCVESNGFVDFYHYLSYGGGVIFDLIGHKAFDLDLNYLYDLPANLVYATYYDGFFYGYLMDGKSELGRSTFAIFKTSVDMDEDLDSNGIKINLSMNNERFQVSGQYGQYSPFIMENGWLFFLQADYNTGKTGYRAITAYNTVTEHTVTKELTGFTGMPWDDGWLTYNNGYFYLTAYVAGLFGGIEHGLEDKFSSIMWVKFDFEKGCFEKPRYKEIESPSGDKFRGIASGLVIHNNRGYLNVRASPDDTMGHTNDIGTCMISYDIMADGTPVPAEAARSLMTHGGIVVNTAHENEGKIHIYLIPYASYLQGIYIFTDELIDGEWVLNDTYSKKHPTNVEYCSQGIRAGSQGEIIYYVDRGYIDSYIPSNRNKITVMLMDSDSAVISSTSGQNAGMALNLLYPTAAISNGIVTIGSEKFTLYGLNEVNTYWEKISDPFKGKWIGKLNYGITEAPYHYIALLKEGSLSHFRPPQDWGWYYSDDDGTYAKCEIMKYDSIDLADGKVLRFFKGEPYGLILPKEVTIPYSGTVNIEITDKAPWTFTQPDPAIASASKIDNRTLSLSYVGEGSTSITVSCADIDYLIAVDSVYSSYVDEEGFMVYREQSEDIDSMGNSLNVVKVLRTSAYITENTVTSITKDSNGNVISKEFDQTVDNRREYFYDDHWYQSKEVTNIKEDGAGMKTAHTVSSAEFVEYTEYDGTRISHVILVDADYISGTKMTTVTDRSEKDTVVLTEVCVKDNNGSVIKTERYACLSYDDSTVAEIVNEKIIITLSGETTVNIIGLVDALKTYDGMPVMIKTEHPVSESIMAMAEKVGATLEYQTPLGSICLSSETLGRLSTIGQLSFSLQQADKSKLNDAQISAIGDMAAFDINLKTGNVNQHDFGKFTIILNISIEKKDGKEVQVWRVDEKGNMLKAENVIHLDETISFDADHLSVYAAGYAGSSEKPQPHTVKFISRGELISESELEVGSHIDEPPIPILQDYRCIGWDIPVPESMPNYDLVFTAVWKSSSLPDDVIANADGTSTEVRSEYRYDGEKNIDVDTLTTQSKDGSIVSETVIMTEGETKNAQQTVTIRATSSLSDDDVSKALAQAGQELSNAGSSVVSDTTVIVDTADSTALEFSGSSVGKISETDSEFCISTRGGSVSFDSSACGTIGGVDGNISFTMDSDRSGLSGIAGSVIGDSEFIDLNLRTDSGSISQLNGIATVSVPFERTDGMKLSVWYVDNAGNKTSVKYSYESGRIVFDTEHFSLFMFEETAEAVPEPDVDPDVKPEPHPDTDPEDTKPDAEPGTSDGGKGSNNTLIFAGIGAVAAVLAVAGIFLLKRRG